MIDRVLFIVPNGTELSTRDSSGEATADGGEVRLRVMGFFCLGLNPGISDSRRFSERFAQRFARKSRKKDILRAGTMGGYFGT
jgi:hypothetical protein